jgi:Peptidase MA superfamily
MVVALRLVIGLLLALAMVAQVAAPAAAAEEWTERRTEQFVLRYRDADPAEVDWYAAAADDAYRFVSEVFGYSPEPGIVLVFHSDEASYVEMNPLAGRAEGVLAHARPSSREIGLALWRLRRQSESLRRDAIRHELTHVVLGELSDNRLPIGFHEGIAQYVERDEQQRTSLVRNLRRGVEVGQLLGLEDLNRQRPFLARASVSYPQSYSVVGFLNDTYGFGNVVRMVSAVREADELDVAAQQAFGKNLAQLEAEWRAYLPSFLDGAWARNDLDLWEMGEPRRLFGEGKYAEAREGFNRAARLFEGLGRAEKLDRARDYLTKSGTGLAAVDSSQRGAAALERFDYAEAADLFGQADAAWQTVGNESYRAAVQSGWEQARRGLEAEQQLGEARALLGGWRIGEARVGAIESGSVFAQLGDAARAGEAEAVLAEARDVQARLGATAVGVGVVGMAGIGLVWGVGRRTRKPEVAAFDRVGVGGASDWSL